jgi:hypothetical protein
VKFYKLFSEPPANDKVYAKNTAGRRDFPFAGVLLPAADTFQFTKDPIIRG